MRDITDRIQAELDLQDHADRIRALAAQFTEISEAERQRLARELHDLVGQNLSALATAVTITVATDDRGTRLEIADDGIGFTPVPIRELDEGRGWGLLTMKERAEAVGGHCRIESAPNQGTRIIVEVGQ